MTANFALRVAGAQIPVGTDIKANTANLLRAIDIAVGKGADILLTPEGSLSGYTHEFDTAAAEHALVEVTTAAPGKKSRPGVGHLLFRRRWALLQPGPLLHP
jgi:predicted amidohydrolase